MSTTTTSPTRAVSFTGGDVLLHGTLTLPDGPGPHPVALLVPGSGPVDRNSDHRRLPLGITRLLADGLAEAGIGSLRYDKRGAGDSGGDFLTAGLSDNIADARSALRFLEGIGDVDASRIVLVGHSEGAVIATAVAAEEQGLAGVALLSAPARNGADTLRWQARALVPTLPGYVRWVTRVLRVDLFAKHERTLEKLRATTTDTARISGRRHNARWFREFLDLDTRPLLERLEMPVFALTGDKDLQTPPEDVDRIGAAVQGPFEGHVLDGVNHILRHDPDEPSLKAYRRQVKQPLDSRVVDLLGAWAATVLAGAPRST